MLHVQSLGDTAWTPLLLIRKRTVPELPQMKILSSLRDKIAPFTGKMGAPELLRLLRLTMDGQRKIFRSTIVVPDRYEIALPAAEYRELGVFRSAMETELTEILPELAREKKYVFLNEPPVVRIVKSANDKQDKATVQAHFSLADEGAGAETAAAHQDGETVDDSDCQPAPRVTLKVLGMGDPPDSTEYNAGIYVLGRGWHADIQINPADNRISRRHCLLRIGGGVIEVEDLGSSNGTLVNDRRIDTVATLQSGDVLGLGDTSVEVRW